MLNIKWKSKAAVKCVSSEKGHQKVHVVTSNDRNPLSLEQQNESCTDCFILFSLLVSMHNMLLSIFIV